MIKVNFNFLNGDFMLYLNINKKHCIVTILGVLFLFFGTSLSFAGAKEDQAFAQWKARQAAQDERLKKETDDNYYLSKPISHENSSKKSTKTSKSSTLNMGKVSLNTASAQQLQQLSGVGAKKAEGIVDYRNQHGAFKSIEELQKVKGIGPKLFEKNKAQLTL